MSVRPVVAVSVIPGTPCCRGVTSISDLRFPVDEAPMLPLDHCGLRYECRCRYERHAEQRSGLDRRRVAFEMQREAFMAAAERRLHPYGRRLTDWAFA